MRVAECLLLAIGEHVHQMILLIIIFYGFLSTLTGNDYIIPYRHFTTIFPGFVINYALAHDRWDTIPQNALDDSGRAHQAKSKHYAGAIRHNLPHIRDKSR